MKKENGNGIKIGYFNGINEISELKVKFRELSKELHPDKNGGNNGDKFVSMKAEFDAKLSMLQEIESQRIANDIMVDFYGLGYSELEISNLRSMVENHGIPLDSLIKGFPDAEAKREKRLAEQKETDWKKYQEAFGRFKSRTIERQKKEIEALKNKHKEQVTRLNDDFQSSYFSDKNYSFDEIKPDNYKRSGGNKIRWKVTLNGNDTSFTKISMLLYEVQNDKGTVWQALWNKLNKTGGYNHSLSGIINSHSAYLGLTEHEKENWQTAYVVIGAKISAKLGKTVLIRQK
jgi:curved DNA-binding protein CbpA